MPQPLRYRLQKKMLTWPWRRVGILAGISLVLATSLIGYLFGMSDHFLGRLFPAFFVLFWLLAVTFLAVVPFVTWATGHWFGRGWQSASQPVARPRRIPPAGPRPVPAAANFRRPTNS